LSDRHENLREDIEFDFKRAAKVLEELKKCKALDRSTDPWLQEVSAEFAASRLQRFYGVFEKLCEKILILKGINLPSLTADYHQFLLDEIIANGLVQDRTHVSYLIDLMKFWHLSKAEYLIDYRCDEVEDKVNAVLELWPVSCHDRAVR
jgi:hypothetical protein